MLKWPTKFFFIALVMYSLSQASWSMMFKEVKILYKSNSGNSLAIDLGDLEGYYPGMSARIYVQRGDLDNPVLFHVANAELIKSFPNKSIWYIEKLIIENGLNSDKTLLIATVADTIQGRKIRIKNKLVGISPKDYRSVDDFKLQNKHNVPSKYIDELENYENLDELFEENKLEEADVVVENHQGYYNESNQNGSTEFDDLVLGKYLIKDKMVRIGDIKKDQDKKIFESMTDGIQAKYNDRKFSLKNGLYFNQKKDAGTREINDRVSLISTFENQKEEDREKTIIHPKVYAKVKRDGDMWSGDMDDSTLRRYFVETGLESEYERRRVVLNENDGHELIFQYGGYLSSHVLSQDVDPAYQNLGYHINVGYDLHLSRTAFELKYWSVQLLAEWSSNFYDAGGFNVKSQEGVYGAYLNYYLLNSPITLKQFIVYFGAGMKFGRSTLHADTLSKRYTYQVVSYPSVQLLTKYRFTFKDANPNNFHMGYGLHAGLTFDVKRLSLQDEATDSIQKVIGVKDLKYVLGLNIYY